MSSTNRSDKRSGHKDDYYITPVGTVREFMRAWDRTAHVPNDLLTKPKPLILDPCAGGDWSGNAATYPVVLDEWGLDCISADLRRDSNAQYQGVDFLTADWQPIIGDAKFDLVISNPPYNLAVEFIERALEVTKPGGWVVMLLRINFLGAQKRGRWWQTHMPQAIYTHSKRPSFYPQNWRQVMPWVKRKGNDSTEYAHYVWQKQSESTYPYRGYVIEHVKGVSDAPGPAVQFGRTLNVIEA